MAIHETIEIGRPPEEVWSYATDPAHLTEWQEKLLEATPETEGPVRVGSRMKQKRDVGLGTRTFTVEVTAYEPPKEFAFKGIDGPVRPEGKVTFEPVDEGRRTRYTIDLDFKGSGLGVLLLPFVRRDAGKQVSESLTHLKQKLELP
jgi:uncharacterized protein YndB with AHSA1/START domain